MSESSTDAVVLAEMCAPHRELPVAGATYVSRILDRSGKLAMHLSTRLIVPVEHFPRDAECLITAEASGTTHSHETSRLQLEKENTVAQAMCHKPRATVFPFTAMNQADSSIFNLPIGGHLEANIRELQHRLGGVTPGDLLGNRSNTRSRNAMQGAQL